MIFVFRYDIMFLTYLVSKLCVNLVCSFTTEVSPHTHANRFPVPDRRAPVVSDQSIILFRFCGTLTFIRLSRDGHDLVDVTKRPALTGRRRTSEIWFV